MIDNLFVSLSAKLPSHWQESRSRKISRRNDSIISLSLEKMEFSVLFLVSIFKMLRKKFSFSSRFMRFFEQFSFSSRFSRFLRKILFCFSIYEIPKQDSLSLLLFSRFWEGKISFSSRLMRFFKWFSFSTQFSRFLEIIQSKLDMLDQ